MKTPTQLTDNKTYNGFGDHTYKPYECPQCETIWEADYAHEHPDHRYALLSDLMDTPLYYDTEDDLREGWKQDIADHYCDPKPLLPRPPL